MPAETVAEIVQRSLAHHRAGRFAEAEKGYRGALQREPRHLDAQNFLAQLLLARGRAAEAAPLAAAVCAQAPTNPRLHNNLGLVHQALGRGAEAQAAFRRALELEPDYAEAQANLGLSLKTAGDIAGAETALRRAVQLKPALAEAHNNLGNLLKDAGRTDEAHAAYDDALKARPGFRAALNNLGNLRKDSGDLAGAVDCYRTILRAEPRDHIAHSNLIYTRLYQAGVAPQELLAEHRAWALAHAEPLTRVAVGHTKHSRAADPERPLHVGFVSADFRSHPVARFLQPVFEQHDRTAYRLFCYADVPRPDAVTETLRTLVPEWRGVVGLNDVALAGQIAADAIDVLVDLSAHTAGNRLLAFARQPAPVQVTYLGYPGTTGMSAMDWRLTDPQLDPEDAARDALYTERSHRLRSYWCYAAPAAATADIEPASATDAARPVTFGCLNNFCKVTPATLETWAALLHAVPGSRLLLHAPEGDARRRVAQTLVAAGIDAARLEFVGRVPAAEYFATYARIDVALDPFPYTGGTTTCDALWMGVPVVTLAGDIAVHRGGVSLLANAGLPEFIADTRESYLRIAAALAADVAQRAELRRTLRARLRASPLMDAAQFARDFEAALRTLWRAWCAAQR